MFIAPATAAGISPDGWYSSCPFSSEIGRKRPSQGQFFLSGVTSLPHTHAKFALDMLVWVDLTMKMDSYLLSSCFFLEADTDLDCSVFVPAIQLVPDRQLQANIQVNPANR